jgi:SseB protein N-terminal domain
VPSLHAAEPLFPGDDGAADPAVLAALTAYDAGRGSEHAALNALASSRLLVPVVAVLTEEAGEDIEAAEDVEATGDSGAGGAAEVSGPGAGLRVEKTTEMAMPTLIGRDGRSAVLAFTSLDALTRWRPDARPVAVPAARAWQAGAEEASAVVIDVAGPVPVTVEGARLAALAAGRPAPLPHQDPDVLAALHAALGGEPLIVQASLTTPDQRAGWEYGPRPEDLPDLAARSAPDLSTLGVDLLASVNGASVNGAGHGAGDPAQDAPAPDTAAHETGPQKTGPQKTGPEEPAAEAGPAPGGAGEDTADLALQVTLADGCDPAAATAAVRRVAEALLTATGGRLRRGMEISVAPPRRAPRPR